MSHVVGTVLTHGFGDVMNGNTLSDEVPEYDETLTQTKELITYMKRTGLVGKLSHTLKQEVRDKLPYMNYY